MLPDGKLPALSHSQAGVSCRIDNREIAVRDSFQTDLIHDIGPSPHGKKMALAVLERVANIRDQAVAERMGIGNQIGPLVKIAVLLGIGCRLRIDRSIRRGIEMVHIPEVKAIPVCECMVQPCQNIIVHRQSGPNSAEILCAGPVHGRSVRHGPGGNQLLHHRVEPIRRDDIIHECIPDNPAGFGPGRSRIVDRNESSGHVKRLGEVASPLLDRRHGQNRNQPVAAARAFIRGEKMGPVSDHRSPQGRPKLIQLERVLDFLVALRGREEVGGIQLVVL